jgi:NAD(P)-dependent dehydrogenase (short-subunit alcohol dehydrogenase family)
MDRLMGKTALITGGARGIGRATAHLFLEERASVMIADVERDPENTVENAVGALRGTSETIAGIRGDVRSLSDARRMVAATVERFGRLDILFCNAGITSATPITDLTEEEWDAVIDTNLKGQFTMVKAAIPEMRRQGGGIIITMGSEMGIVAVPNSPAYNASKGGVVMFTKSIALDLIQHNIRVNCLCPGITATPLLQEEVDSSPDPAEAARLNETWAPIMRPADPMEMARGALFLASEESSFAVGSLLVLDGGFTAR